MQFLRPTYGKEISWSARPDRIRAGRKASGELLHTRTAESSALPDFHLHPEASLPVHKNRCEDDFFAGDRYCMRGSSP